MLTRRNFLATAPVVLALPSAMLTTGCDTSWIATAQKDLPAIEAILDSVSSVVAAASGNGLLTPVITTGIHAGIVAANVSFTLLGQLMDDYSKTKNPTVLGKIDATLTDLAANLNDILTAADIKNAALRATITTGLAVAISVVSTVQLLIPPAPSASARRRLAPTTLHGKPIVPPSEQLKSMYNSVAVLNGYSAHQVK